MKKLIISAVLALAGLLVSPAISAQGKLVTLNLKNQPLSEFIKAVEKQTDCKFFYESSTIDRRVPDNGAAYIEELAVGLILDRFDKFRQRLDFQIQSDQFP